LSIEQPIGRAAIILASILILSACGRWSGAQLEEQTVQRVDSQLEIGLDEATFRQRFPEAEVWREEGGARDYLVTVEKLCFVCFSRDAFFPSNDYFVRSVRFQDEQLVAIEPVELNY
jgi:hypothetical protein